MTQNIADSDTHWEEWDAGPTIEVRVFRHGKRVHRELCESEEQASLIVDAWAELEGVVCEVDDLSVRHLPGEILAPEPAEVTDEGYRDQVELDTGAGRE